MTSDITTILFDMDGTLYQDFKFHRQYLKYCLENTAAQAFLPEALDVADKTLCGEGLAMNRFYRLKPGEGLNVQAQLLGALMRGLIDEMPFEACYQNGLGDLHFLGDPWEVVVYIAHALNVSPDAGEAAFHRVREDMHKDSIEPNTELLEILELLKVRYRTILLSNSPEKSASDFIAKLGFTHSFSEKIYDANKPFAFLEKVFELHPDLRQTPECILSIGDHAFNEIENVIAIGGKTLWMNPYGPAAQIQTTWTVRSINELIEFSKKNLL